MNRRIRAVNGNLQRHTSLVFVGRGQGVLEHFSTEGIKDRRETREEEVESYGV